MKTITILPARRTPLTAAQYLTHCQAKRNRLACARLDFRDACIRLAWTLAALVALAAVIGGLIHVAILLSR